MTQGYAIYLRTHRETGKQYGGCVWWTKPEQTAEKACQRRWRQEDKQGIRGLFGGFDSMIVLSEKRSDAPEMSEGLYRIRIAVDEEMTINAIPKIKCLNLVSPLLQVGRGFYSSEEVARLGGRRGGKATNATTEGRKGAGCRVGGSIAGRQNFKKKIGIHGRSMKQKIADGLRGGHLGGVITKEKNLGIFAIGYNRSSAGRSGGLKGGKMTAAIPGHMAKAGRASHSNEAEEKRQLTRFLKTVVWG